MDRWKPQTFRAMVWEYAPLPLIFGGLLFVPLHFLLPHPWRGVVALFVLVWYTPLYFYWLSVTRKYPARGDLPEFQEWYRRRIAELDERRDAS